MSDRPAPDAEGDVRARNAATEARAAVNRVARALRLRFLQTQDVDAFRQLVLLVEAPLLPVAHALTRELGLALPASQLLADHLAEIFTDLREPADDEPDVLGAAEVAMRRLGEQRLEALRVATGRGEARPDLLPSDAQGQMRTLAGHERDGLHFLVVVNHAFHDLSIDDRILLLAVDVDRIPLAKWARSAGLRQAMARRRLRKARVRLAAAIAAHGVTMTNADGTPSAPANGLAPIADLIYELAKACLMRVPNVHRRIRCVVEPREAPVIADELRRVARRRDSFAEPVDLAGLPSEAPPEADALHAAARCLRALERVEGCTPRQVLCMAQVHMFEDHPERAEAQLRALLARPLSNEMRGHTQVNLILALTKQHKNADAITLGEQALEHQPDNWQLLFNLAVAYSHANDRAAFRSASTRLAPLTSTEYQRNLIAYEVPRFAEELREDPAQVALWLGIGAA